MATTAYEGKLQTTKRWPEASDTLCGETHGGLTPFELLIMKLKELQAGTAQLVIDDKEIWIDGECWVRINIDGTVEIGMAGA